MYYDDDDIVVDFIKTMKELRKPKVFFGTVMMLIFIFELQIIAAMLAG